MSNTVSVENKFYAVAAPGCVVYFKVPEEISGGTKFKEMLNEMSLMKNYSATLNSSMTKILEDASFIAIQTSSSTGMDFFNFVEEGVVATLNDMASFFNVAVFKSTNREYMEFVDYALEKLHLSVDKIATTRNRGIILDLFDWITSNASNLLEDRGTFIFEKGTDVNNPKDKDKIRIYSAYLETDENMSILNNTQYFIQEYSFDSVKLPGKKSGANGKLIRQWSEGGFDGSVHKREIKAKFDE